MFQKSCGKKKGHVDISPLTNEIVQTLKDSAIYHRLLAIRLLFRVLFHDCKSVFAYNRDEISSHDETCPGIKKILFTYDFHPGI